MSKLMFRNRRGELVEVPTVAATRFKNEFGRIFEEAGRDGIAAITKHGTPKAVLLSYGEFESLVQARSPALDDLSARFDALLTRLQTGEARQGMAAAFDATPAELGRAAVEAAAGQRRAAVRRAKTTAR